MEPVPLLDLRAQYATLKGEIEPVVRSIVESQYFILGPTVERFEAEVARFVGVPHAIGCASGTDALMLSLAALGVRAGDEVITVPFSFFATASTSTMLGARPVFVDIEPGTFNLDPDRLEAAITERTRAIIPVHLFGQSADLDAILEIAERRGIPVVEDAAQSLGAVYHSARRGASFRSGALGSFGCYSFFPSKNLGGFGDGGMVVSSDPALADRVRKLRTHGGKDRYRHEMIGWNSRLDALQAGVLAVKLPHLDSWSRGRAANAARYDRMLTEAGLVDRECVTLPARAAYAEHIFNQYTLRVQRRDALIAHLTEAQIGHAIYYPIPLHLQECFAHLGYQKGDFPESEMAAGEVLSLPVYPEMPRHHQERVVESLVAFYARGQTD